MVSSNCKPKILESKVTLRLESAVWCVKGKTVNPASVELKLVTEEAAKSLFALLSDLQDGGRKISWPAIEAWWEGVSRVFIS